MTLKQYGKSLFGGAVATLFMTFMMYYVAPLLLGGPMDIATMLGQMLGVSRSSGMLLHYFNGIILFPLIYSLFVYPILRGSPLRRGTLWGVALWFIAQTVVLPFAGAGFFSANAGGLMAVLTSLAGHIVYGAVLGALSGHQERIEIQKVKISQPLT